MIVSAESASSESPVTLASVTVGTPTLPNAVGAAFTIRRAKTVGRASKPIATRIPAGIATAVPNPAIPSMKKPKPNPMIRARIRLSSETPDSIFFIVFMPPVFKDRL